MFAGRGRGSAVHASDVNSNKIKTKPIKLENRASVGIRAISDDFTFKGKPVFVTIETHHVRGKYMVDEYDGVTHQYTGADTVWFDKFDQAKNFIKAKYGSKVELDDKNSNNYQTWKQNIEHADKELPIDRLYWSMPEEITSKIRNGESTREFLRRVKHQYPRKYGHLNV